MGSKAFLFLGLFLAIFLVISSEVAARELAETSNAVKFDTGDGVAVGDHYYKKPKKCYSCCRKTKYGCKKYCCSYEEYVAMEKENVESHN